MPSVSELLLENYANYYTEDIRQWRRLGAADKAANIIKLCAAVPHERVIEVGCGEGAVMAELLKQGFCREILGLEISPSAVRIAADSGLNVRLFDGDSISESADLVILTHVVEHLEHPRKLLYAASSAAPHIFVEVPLEDNLRLPADYPF